MRLTEAPVTFVLEAGAVIVAVGLVLSTLTVTIDETKILPTLSVVVTRRSYRPFRPVVSQVTE